MSKVKVLVHTFKWVCPICHEEIEANTVSENLDEQDLQEVAQENYLFEVGEHMIDEHGAGSHSFKIELEDEDWDAE